MLHLVTNFCMSGDVCAYDPCCAVNTFGVSLRVLISLLAVPAEPCGMHPTESGEETGPQRARDPRPSPRSVMAEHGAVPVLPPAPPPPHLQGTVSLCQSPEVSAEPVGSSPSCLWDAQSFLALLKARTLPAGAPWRTAAQLPLEASLVGGQHLAREACSIGSSNGWETHP